MGTACSTRRHAGDTRLRARHPCRVIVEEVLDGATNLAVDELLLDQVSQELAQPETYLRFYSWAQPTLSLGLAQRPSRVVDFDFCQRQGIQIVRRATGGKAVLHHHEVTYSLISNDRLLFPDWSIEETYRAIAGALRLGLEFLGIETTLAGPASPPGRRAVAHPSAACFAVSQHHEILSEGRKLVGSAQRRSRSGFLQHGSILIDFDSHLLRGALRGDTSPALASKVATIRSCLGYVPDRVSVISCILRGFDRTFPLRIEPQPLDSGLRSRAAELGKKRLVKQP